MILKILELVKKNFPINEAVEPSAIKTKEKPKVKKIVLTTIKFLFLSLFYQKMFRKYMKCIQELKEERMVTKN